MASRLVNVRLDPDRRRKAAVLRERGVTLSDVVRQAIDDKYDAVRASDSALDVLAVMTQIFERYPDPAKLPRRRYNVHDSRAARRAIRRAQRSRRA